MDLAFEPTYTPNTIDGTDVRDGNGDLKGFTSRRSNGYFSARVATGPEIGKCLGVNFASDPAAQVAILAYCAEMGW
jgi:hypothetical protein